MAPAARARPVTARPASWYAGTHSSKAAAATSVPAPNPATSPSARRETFHRNAIHAPRISDACPRKAQRPASITRRRYARRRMVDATSGRLAPFVERVLGRVDVGEEPQYRLVETVGRLGHQPVRRARDHLEPRVRDQLGQL